MDSRLYKIVGPKEDADVGAFIQLPWRQTKEEKIREASGKKEKEALREQVAAIVAGYNVTAPNENDQFDIKKAVLRILNLHFNFDSR